jgi:hypothetical protein
MLYCFFKNALMIKIARLAPYYYSAYFFLNWQEPASNKDNEH